MWNWSHMNVMFILSLLHFSAHIHIWTGVLVDSVGCDVIINEVNPDNPGAGSDTKEYVELYNTDRNNVSLDGYVLVFWNGGLSPPQAYNVFNLSGFCMDGQGFFLIGREAVQPKPNIVGTAPPGSGFLQNGNGKCDAVALYKGNPDNYTVGMQLTKIGLVDAVAYDKNANSDCSRIIPSLFPNQTWLHENSSFCSSDESLSRCTGNDRLVLGQFEVRRISPGSSNLCNDSDENTTSSIVSRTTQAQTEGTHKDNVTSQDITTNGFGRVQENTSTMIISDTAVVIIVAVCLFVAVVAVVLIIFIRNRKRGGKSRNDNVLIAKEFDNLLSANNVPDEDDPKEDSPVPPV